MTTQDTIELLRECDAGVKMGISSMDQVLDKVNSDKLKEILSDNKKAHESLADEMQHMLAEAHCDNGQPNMMAQGMSWIKTELMTAMDGRDETIADLMTDGCDMGVKSLRKYLNQYESASEESKRMCRRIIDTEEDLRNRLKEFL